MTTLKKIVKYCFCIAILVNINSCSRFTEESDYLESANIQSKLDKTIISILASSPYPNFVTIYFTESDAKRYIFVTPRRTINNTRSKYYFNKNKKLIIIGYKSEKLEKVFANFKSSKPEKIFNVTKNSLEVYDGRPVVFEILNSNSIQEITPTGKILELNDYGLVEFNPPLKK